MRPQLLTKKNRENTSPSWSPDGKMIAFSAKIDGVRQIWIYNFDTEEETPLTTGPQNKENPAWAPDSLHLVYNTDNEENGELFLINLNQKTPTQISRGPGQNGLHRGSRNEYRQEIANPLHLNYKFYEVL